MARLVLELGSRPFGWRFSSIANTFGVSSRTVLRYVGTLRRELVDSSGHPLVEVTGSGSARALRLRRPEVPADTSSYEVASLFFTLTMLKFLEGTVLKGGLEHVSERIVERLTTSQRRRLVDLDRKFYAVQYTPKDYQGFDEQLDTILRALMDSHRLQMEYRGVSGETHRHEFDPYTLVAYRGGLYLLGHSSRADEVVWLAIERIRAVDFVKDATGGNVRFEMPSDYHPNRYTEGMFGIVSGDETKVDLLVRSAETELFLRSRLIHPSQQFRKRKDGKTVLSMTVRGTTELRNWLLSFGPWLEVLRPKVLRDEVAALIAESNRHYSRAH